MAVGVTDIARLRPLRQAAWIQTRVAMMEFIATAVRQRKGHVPIADTGELRRQIDEMPRHEMRHLALALNAAAHSIIPAARITRRCASIWNVPSVSAFKSSLSVGSPHRLPPP